MKTTPLYGGRILLDFEESSHQYFIEKQPIPSVTTITGLLDKSAPLMGWAVSEAFKAAKRILVPGIQIDEEVINALGKEMRAAPARVVTDAAEVGTVAHKWCEEFIYSKMLFLDPPDPPSDPRVLSATEAFTKWVRNNNVQFIHSERKVYSEQLNYCGTLDIVAMVNGVMTLVDLKTSNSFHPEYMMQTAAYMSAFNEEMLRTQRPEDEIKSRLILMIGKEDAMLTPIPLPDDQYLQDLAGFTGLLHAYEWTQRDDVRKLRERGKKRKHRS